MTDDSISEMEREQCPSKIGRDIRKIGKKSDVPFSNAPETVAKVAPLIQIAEPETTILTQSPDLGLCLPSLTSITSQKTAIQQTSAPGASDATSPTTEIIMSELAIKPARSLITTGSRRSLAGKPTRKDLIQAHRNDELMLHLCQLQLETYKPAMDAMKLYLEIHGSQSPNFYMTRNKQVAAACQMNGVNDPNATRKQRIAAITCYEMIHESIMRCLELGLGKEETKKTLNEAIEKAATFFGLGNKKTVKARRKTKEEDGEKV